MTTKSLGKARPWARARDASLLSATMLATGLLHSAEAARFGIVVNPAQDSLLTGLTIPDAAPTIGMWSSVQAWPMNAIASGLLPSGKVLTYGTPVGGDPGNQDGRTFDIWDPYQGFAQNSHVTLRGLGGVNSFCATTAFQADGSVLISGGIFDAGNDKGSVILNNTATGLSLATAKLANDRYYSTMITLPDGQQLIMGGSYPYQGSWTDPQGSIDKGWMTGMTPEVYGGGTWRSLFGANSRDAFGPDYNRFWYPRAWVAPTGKVFGISAEKMWYLDPAGNGTINVMPFKEPQRTASTAADAPNVGASSTAVMYDTGKILQVGGNSYDNSNGFLSSSRATIVDINGGAPALAETTPMNFGRGWATATVLPTGLVAVVGGSMNNDSGDKPVFASEFWDPKTGKWSLGASNAVYRGYHSTTILLQNGALLVAGGGAPGPVANKNAELYYPSYLFTTANGKAALAPRPQIVSLNTLQLEHGKSMQFELASQNGLSQVALVGLSQVTHSFNNTQRRYQATFTHTDQTVTVQAPSSTNIAPPGYYQLVAIDQKGVPSPGVIIAIGAVNAPPQASTPVVGTPAASGGTSANGGATSGTGTGTTTGGTGTGTTTTGTGGIAAGGPGGLVLKTAHSGLCLASSGTSDGTAITQQTCSGKAEQSWTVKSVTGGSALVNGANGKCLDMSALSGPARNRTPIIQWTCHGGANQAWTTKAQNGGNGFVSLSSNLCLDVSDASMQVGGGTIAWTCQGSMNQTFSTTGTGGIAAGGPGGLVLKTAHSGLCLASSGTSDGTAITQQTCSGKAEQSWTVKSVTGGSALVNGANGKCLDMSALSGPARNRTPIIQWTCHGGANQAWTTKAQNGGNGFVSLSSNLCLDVSDASTQVGGGTIAWTCQGSMNQTFSTTGTGGTLASSATNAR